MTEVYENPSSSASPVRVHTDATFSVSRFRDGRISIRMSKEMMDTIFERDSTDIAIDGGIPITVDYSTNVDHTTLMFYYDEDSSVRLREQNDGKWRAQFPKTAVDGFPKDQFNSMTETSIYEKGCSWSFMKNILCIKFPLSDEEIKRSEEEYLKEQEEWDQFMIDIEKVKEDPSLREAFESIKTSVNLSHVPLRDIVRELNDRVKREGMELSIKDGIVIVFAM